MIQCTAVTIVVTIMLGVSSVYAHNKKLAKDGCHNMAGVLHHHPVGATKINGPCERKGKITIKTINRTVEVLVKQPAEVTIKEIKHINVQKFEAAMDAVTSRLEKVIQTEANRPARIVTQTVEVPVMDSSKASTMCIKLRGEYFSCEDRWGCKENAVVKRAISRGCW